MARRERRKERQSSLSESRGQFRTQWLQNSSPLMNMMEPGLPSRYMTEWIFQKTTSQRTIRIRAVLRLTDFAIQPLRVGGCCLKFSSTPSLKANRERISFRRRRVGVPRWKYSAASEVILLLLLLCLEGVTTMARDLIWSIYIGRSLVPRLMRLEKC